ncbi:MAG: DUF58 domain-containing protein [Chloroflexota bacterium]
MHHDILRVLAQYVSYLLLLILPALTVILSDRFRRPLAPEQYALLFALAAAVGILLFLPAVSIVAGTAFLAVVIARLSARYALARVTYERSLVPVRLFRDDEANLVVRVTNNKLLPLASLTITDPIRFGLIRPSDDLDDILLFSGGIQILDDLGHALVNRTAVAPFQVVTRTYTVKGLRRGVYTLGPAVLSAGDPFGIFRREVTLGGSLEIMVYPRLFKPDEIGLPFRQSMGELVARRSLYEDPTLLAGSREYRPGDPLHRMHWKSTARTGELQVRVNDPSTTAQIMMVLNLNTFQHVWQGVDLDRMESAIDVAASFGTWALDKGFAVGVRSNGVVPGMESTPRMPPSANPRQSSHLLEHLSRLSYSGRFRPETVLMDESRRLQAGGSIVFVTSIITPELVRVLTSRHLRGRVSVVYCGRFAAPVVRGVPIYLATPPKELRSAVS